MGEFHFLRPHWLWLLPLIAALVYWLLQGRQRSRSWSAVCDPQLLPFLLQGHTGPQPRRYAPWWIGLAATLLLLALAGPSWERLPQPVFRDQSALVIALDLSRSMDATDLKPSRLNRAVLKITDILRSRKTGQTALLIYAGDAFTVSPLTDDVDTIIAQLPALDTGLPPTQGSHADTALHMATNLLRQAGATHGRVLLVTDGVIDNAALQGALAELQQQGHRLSILGVGTAQGAPVPLAGGGFLKDAQGTIVVPRLDSAVLQALAQRSGGRYTELRSDDRDLRYLLPDVQEHHPAGTEATTGLHTDQWREQGPWLILLVIPLAALAFRRGLWMLLPLLLLPLPDPAQAMDWQDLWQRPDQQAMQSLQQGDAQQAAEQFTDPQWKAAAQYRAEQYEQAAQTLQGVDSADALYNRGNALARAGRYPEAMASYEQALQRDPQHEDARHNLELLQQQQQQQQQQQGQDQQGQPQTQPSSDGAGQQGQPGDTDDQGSSADQPHDAQDPSSQTNASGASQTADPHTSSPAQPQAESQQADTDQPAAATEPTPSPTEPGDTQAALDREDPASTERDEASERWLRRIPDDPGGLLRRKFRYQYQQRDARGAPEEQPW